MLSATRRLFATSTNKIKTGIVFFNLGGPSTLAEVNPFLTRLFSDPDLIPLPFQSKLAPWIAQRRTPKIQAQYEAIGGGSPIGTWTQKQADALVASLSQLYPDREFKSYIAFRYAEPLTEQALDQMDRDGIEHAIGFTQYPQWSCSTTGSSLNELVRHLKQRSGTVSDAKSWSLIDRWPTHPKLIKAFAHLIREKLETYPEEVRSSVVLLFSAHSLPMSVVNRGDPYPLEVASTVQAIMQELGYANTYRLCWQSKVGPSAWLGPSTENALKGFHKAGHKNIMLVPVAFTSDHIETLYELDLEYGEVAKEMGVSGLTRCDSLNDHPVFIDALVQVAKEHLDSQTQGKKWSKQFELRCPGCDKASCKQTREFFQV